MVEFRKLINRARDIYREEGTTELLSKTYSVLRFRIKQISQGSSYAESRSDNNKRWSLIKPHIQTQKTFLDIGCAEGYFISKASNSGLLSLGIDNREKRLKRAQKMQGFESNNGFANWELSPETVTKIPSFDVISLQTVFHHISRDFGYKKSKDILQQLSSKSNIIVYEPPGDRWIGLENITIIAVNTETQKRHQIDSLGKSMHEPDGWPINRPRIGKKLPQGHYTIKAKSEKYGESNSYEIKVGKSNRIIGERPRLKIEKSNLKIVDGEETGIDDMVKYYVNQTKDILGDEIEFLEKTTVEYRGEKRKDPFFVIDTSSISNT